MYTFEEPRIDIKNEKNNISGAINEFIINYIHISPLKDQFVSYIMKMFYYTRFLKIVMALINALL